MVWDLGKGPGGERCGEIFLFFFNLLVFFFSSFGFVGWSIVSAHSLCWGYMHPTQTWSPAGVAGMYLGCVLQRAHGKKTPDLAVQLAERTSVRCMCRRGLSENISFVCAGSGVVLGLGFRTLACAVPGRPGDRTRLKAPALDLRLNLATLRVLQR
jgi:hypothetical protein